MRAKKRTVLGPHPRRNNSPEKPVKLHLLSRYVRSSGVCHKALEVLQSLGCVENIEPDALERFVTDSPYVNQRLQGNPLLRLSDVYDRESRARQTRLRNSRFQFLHGDQACRPASLCAGGKTRSMPDGNAV